MAKSIYYKLMFYFLVYTLSALFTVFVLIRCVYRWLTKSSGSYFKVKNRPLPPKCLNDPDLGTHNYVQLENVKYHYVEKGDRNKPLLLCLHGFPEFWYSWRHQIKEFSNDYWVVAPDMRGYGESEKPEGIKYYKVKYLVEDVHHLIKALGKDKVTLVAHDWGALIAWYFVYKYTEMVDTYVILNAPHPFTFRKEILKNWSQFIKSWYIFFFQMPYIPEIVNRLEDLKALNVVFYSKKHISPYSEEDREAFRFTFGKPGAFTPPLNYYRANFGPTNFKTDFQKPLPPGLLIIGGNDIALLYSTMASAKTCVPNLTIEKVEGATHFVQQDDPQAVNQLMKEFFNKLPQLKKEQKVEELVG